MLCTQSFDFELYGFVNSHFEKENLVMVYILGTRESTKGVMTVRKYCFLLANSSHKYIWELYILAKYWNFILNVQNFEKNFPDISE